MAKNLSNWQKFGRFLTPVVALCFFLPFFGISCDGTEIVTISGTDMVAGCKPGGLAADMDSAKDDGMGMGGMGGHHGGGHVESKVQNVKRSPLAIAAFAIALIASGLAWVRTRRALIASCALSFAGLAALIALYITTTGELKDMTKKGMDLGGGSKHEDSGGFHLKPDREPNIDAGSRFGLWVTCLGFVGVATMTTLAVREKEGPPAPPAPAPAPGAPPPV